MFCLHICPARKSWPVVLAKQPVISDSCAAAAALLEQATPTEQPSQLGTTGKAILAQQQMAPPRKTICWSCRTLAA
jgi:hypothetical protein